MMGKKFGKNFAFYAALATGALIVFIMLKVIVFTIVAAIGGFIIGMIFAMILAHRLPLFKEENGYSSSGEEVSVKNPPQPVNIHMESMMLSLKKVMKLFLGCKISKVDPEIIAEIESIIGNILEVAPRLNSEHPGTELTYVVNKISDEYLHQIVGTYIKLSPEGRVAQKGEVVSVLRGLNAEIKDIYGLVESQNVGEFKTHAKFVRNKFFGETVEA